MLKSAFEIALEKQETYEELSGITAELLEHVAMLEECWDAIQPSVLPSVLPSEPQPERSSFLPEAA
jgi:hypothetical protein